MELYIDPSPVDYPDVDTFISSGLTNTDPPADEKCCSICYMDWDSEDEIVRTDCNHIFHKDCISAWLLTPKASGLWFSSCPFGRQQLCLTKWGSTWAIHFRKASEVIEKRLYSWAAEHYDSCKWDFGKLEEFDEFARRIMHAALIYCQHVRSRAIACTPNATSSITDAFLSYLFWESWAALVTKSSASKGPTAWWWPMESIARHLKYDSPRQDLTEIELLYIDDFHPPLT